MTKALSGFTIQNLLIAPNWSFANFNGWRCNDNRCRTAGAKGDLLKKLGIYLNSIWLLKLLHISKMHWVARAQYLGSISPNLPGCLILHFTTAKYFYSSTSSRSREAKNAQNVTAKVKRNSRLIVMGASEAKLRLADDACMCANETGF